MEETIICPYPGLRPFHEDESIFFKGRDEHIEQITRQLEAKKFLMLTGASGDGKSSLVYAGLIPNARAGFFKAKFNNWVVADFRPERAPLTNMGESIGNALAISADVKIEKELSYGFSSLIDLYKNSKYWVDQNSDSFKNLAADDQKKAKRRGANLLILVDQFEEFFTNPENYSHGKVSIESQTVVNLLLETTRLAIEQDIPIYIVCTMRSDYIGQCASFRGLPEYIGYSQFFVPRLKRKEVYQVIEEPALLNGNKISKRLVEMLINEMNDGIDQLPVLQHALNQIWQKAEKGTVEMDVIHFAKINGIPKNQLSKADKDEFETWFETIPEFKKALFVNASLGNVLDAHANELYETSGVVLEDKDDEVAKLIVEKTFKCLTKIDESRAVRNRMSLMEVTQIINDPAISSNKVGKVLDVFRIQGNTFLKPFITEDKESHIIREEDVLDITHESLIRNWNKLTDWAKEEHDNLLIWQDFNKQLQRWAENNKSSGYLLPIGPLTFFETWFNNTKPNKYWLARYDERDVSREEKLKDAENSLANAHQFIKRSARRLFVSRTVMKYGVDKIITVFGLALLIFSCTYFYFDFRKKENSYVIENIQSKGKELLKSKYIKNSVKADFILTMNRMQPGAYIELIKLIEDDSSRFDIYKEMFVTCLNYQQNKLDSDPEIEITNDLFEEQINLLQKKIVKGGDEGFINNMDNILSVVYGHIVLKRNTNKIQNEEVYKQFSSKVFFGFKDLLRNKNALKLIEIEKFNRFLQAVPEIVSYDQTKLKEVVGLISPYNSETSDVFNTLYPKQSSVKQNWNENIKHNGGYYHLCNLYILTQDFKNLNRSYDSLIASNKNFLSANYGYCYTRLLYDLVIVNRLFDNEGKLFVKRIESGLPVKPKYDLTFMTVSSLLLNQKDMESYQIRDFTKADWYSAADLELQLENIFWDRTEELSKSLVKEIQDNASMNNDEKNYLLSLFYKRKAFGNNVAHNNNPEKIKENLKISFEYYKKVSKEYLNGDISVGMGLDQKSYNREAYFKYPGCVYFENSNVFGQWLLYQFKNKSIFIDYVNEHENFAEFFMKNEKVGEGLNRFISNYSSHITFTNRNEKYFETNAIEECYKNGTLSKSINKDMLLAYLSSFYQAKGDSKRALEYAELCNIKELLDKNKLKSNDNADVCYRLAKNIAITYAKQKNVSKVKQIIFQFPEKFQQRNALLLSVDSLQEYKQHASSISLLDSLINTHVLKSSKHGNKLFELLGKVSTSATDKIALNLMKDKPDNTKVACLNYFIKGKVNVGEYYQAVKMIPDYLSSSSQLKLYSTILKENIFLADKVRNRIWSSLDDNTWGDMPYENSDGGMNFITVE